MKIIKTYKEGISSLEVDGLPDQSQGHGADTLGILLSWRLNLIGLSVLEGKKEHLINLVYVILTYSRFCISGLAESVSDASNLVNITRINDRHHLRLRSTQEGVKPLSILLDDAELSDLTRCFDKLIADNQMVINWVKPLSKPPLKKQDYINFSLFKKLIIPFVGIGSLLTLAFVFINLSLPPVPTEPTEDRLDSKSSQNVTTN